MDMYPPILCEAEANTGVSDTNARTHRALYSSVMAVHHVQEVQARLGSAAGPRAKFMHAHCPLPC